MAETKRWGHDELAHDLAEHMRANTEIIAWEDMQLGPAGSARPDVYTIRKSYSRFVPVVYEVKVSVSDFRSDITSGKWQRYLRYASAVVFAVPAGLIKKEDVPAGCGLIVRHDEIWRTVKNPTLQRLETLPHEAWVKLVIDGIGREVSRQRVAEPRARAVNHWQAAQAVRKRHGDRIGQLLSNLGSAEASIEVAIERAHEQAHEIEAGTQRQLRNAIEFARQGQDRLDREFLSLARALGLGEDATASQLADAVHDARWRLLNDDEVKRLRAKLESIRRAFNDGLQPLPGEQCNDNTPSAAGAMDRHA